MKKLNYIILPVIFFGFIYYMFFNQIFGWKTFENKAENRALTKYPEFDVNRLDKFPEEYDAYLNDNFTYRGLFLNAFHELKFQMGITPDDSDVIIGKNGNFFLTENRKDSVKFVLEDNLQLFHELWNVKKKYLDDLNIPFYWVIAPDKYHVYPEDLPSGRYKHINNYGIALKSYFDKEFPNTVVYPLMDLRFGKEKQTFYLKQDTHWGEKGAFVGYQALMKSIQMKDASIRIVNEKDFTWKSKVNHKGNLLPFIGKEGKMSEKVYFASFYDSSVEAAPLFNFKSTEGFPYPWEYEFHFVNEKALNKKRVLVIRDSYGEAIIPFLNETFNETLYIFDAWKFVVNKQIVETYKPDLIIFLSLESHVRNMFDHDPVIDFEK